MIDEKLFVQEQSPTLDSLGFSYYNQSTLFSSCVEWKMKNSKLLCRFRGTKVEAAATLRFLSNKLRCDDQASKLRECLKGNARKLVPASMECMDDCWSTLDVMYRDPSCVMNARKKKIK